MQAAAARRTVGLWEEQLSWSRLTHGDSVHGAQSVLSIVSCWNPRDSATPTHAHIYTTTKKHPMLAVCVYLGVRE